MSILIGPPGGKVESSLPPLVAENIESFKGQHPALSHQLFTNDHIPDLLEEKFSREVVDAFNALRPRAYKADLAMYCLLYEFGGIYADLSYYFTQPLPIEDGRPIVFRDLLWSAPWDTSCGLIASPRRHKAFLRAIELVCANVRKTYYGSTPLCPTGPALFGKALAQTCEAEELLTGKAAAMKAELMRKLVPGVELPDAPRVHCLTLYNKVTAIKRKPLFSMGLGALGIAGSDNYAEQWHQRAVYEVQGAQDAGQEQA